MDRLGQGPAITFRPQRQAQESRGATRFRCFDVPVEGLEDLLAKGGTGGDAVTRALFGDQVGDDLAMGGATERL